MDTRAEVSQFLKAPRAQITPEFERLAPLGDDRLVLSAYWAQPGSRDEDALALLGSRTTAESSAPSG